jgi:hypothetical protein
MISVSKLFSREINKTLGTFGTDAAHEKNTKNLKKLLKN